VSAGLNKFFSGLIVLLFVFSGFTPAKATTVNFDTSLANALVNTANKTSSGNFGMYVYLPDTVGYVGEFLFNRGTQPELFNTISVVNDYVEFGMESEANAFTLNSPVFVSQVSGMFGSSTSTTSTPGAIGDLVGNNTVTDIRIETPASDTYRLVTEMASNTTTVLYTRNVVQFVVSGGNVTQLDLIKYTSRYSDFRSFVNVSEPIKLIMYFDSVFTNTWDRYVSNYKSSNFVSASLTASKSVIALIKKSQSAAAKTGVSVLETKMFDFSTVTYKPSTKTEIYVGQTSKRAAKVVDFGKANDQFKYLSGQIFSRDNAYSARAISYSKTTKTWTLKPTAGGTIKLVVNSKGLISKVSLTGLQNSVGGPISPATYAISYAPNAAIFKAWGGLNASQRKLTGFFSACKNGGYFYADPASAVTSFASNVLTCNTTGHGHYKTLDATGISATGIRAVAAKWGFTVIGL